MKHELITINGKNFELYRQSTVKNPLVFYKSVYDVYSHCSQTKEAIWESWANWFRECNSHMFGVTSHNCNFFTISGCVTWIDPATNKPSELFLVITASHNKAWIVKRD